MDGYVRHVGSVLRVLLLNIVCVDFLAVDLFSKDVFQTDNVRLPRRSFQSLGNSLRFRSKEKWQISYRIG